MTPETDRDLEWLEQACADDLAALRAKLDGCSPADREIYLLVRCLRLAHEKAVLVEAFARIEDTARDMAKLAKLARRQGESP